MNDHPGDGAHEGHRQPRGDPERIAPPEEQPQDQEHQPEPLHAVVQQHGQAVPHDGGYVAGDLEHHARRRAAALLFEVGVEFVDDVEDVVVPVLLHHQKGRRLAVEDVLLPRPLESVGDGGDVPQPDHGAAGRSHHHQPFERVRAPPFVVEPDQHRAVAGLHRSGRQGHALAGYGIGPGRPR